MQERIKKILDYSGMNQQDFANKIAISPASLTNILKGRSNATLPIVLNIREGFPEINFDWLLYGNGEMLNADSDNPTSMQQHPLQNMPNLFADMTTDDLHPSQASPVNPLRNDAANGTPTSRTESVQNNRSADTTIPPIIKYIDKPQRRVKEIQVFYDDDTYEVFVPRK